MVFEIQYITYNEIKIEYIRRITVKNIEYDYGFRYIITMQVKTKEISNRNFKMNCCYVK